LQQLVAEVSQRSGRSQFVSDNWNLPIGGVEVHRGLTDESVGVAHVEPGHGMSLAVAPIDVEDDGPTLLLGHFVLPGVGTSMWMAERSSPVRSEAALLRRLCSRD
jgi:hypothetical protein